MTSLEFEMAKVNGEMIQFKN